MKKKVVKKRNRKAQDATLINVDSLKKRMVRLEFLVEGLIRDVSKLFDKVQE